MSEIVEENVEEILSAFFAEHMLVEFVGDVDANSDLFQLGIIDSYTYIELIRFIETKFALKFTSAEILSNVMVSLADITSLVLEKRAAQA